MNRRRSLPRRVHALLGALLLWTLALPAMASDGLGPGAYWTLLVMFVLVLLAGALVLVGFVALVVWLVRRRRRA